MRPYPPHFGYDEYGDLYEPGPHSYPLSRPRKYLIINLSPVSDLDDQYPELVLSNVHNDTVITNSQSVPGRVGQLDHILFKWIILELADRFIDPFGNGPFELFQFFNGPLVPNDVKWH